MSTVVFADKARIPDGIADLEAFRRWACSEEFPRRGWISYLDGEIWVDLSMEQLFTHNRVKMQYTVVLGSLAESEQQGYFFSDRVRLSNPEANLSTEPDGLFVSYEAIRSRRARLIEGAEEGYIELEGSADMTLEVVSADSVKKDTEVLRELYWRAGVIEYWLVDARRVPLRFDVLRRTARGYVATRRQGPWVRSVVFGKAFALEQQADQLGHPQFTLRTRDR